MAKHNELGKEGEQLASAYLISKGYTILHRNYRYRKAEIDIIARFEDVVAIVEVKVRSSTFFENIAETVNRKKINLVVMAADHYITENDLDVEVRFDIITILKSSDTSKIEHIEDAFYHF
ncbi:MAG: YraN family protein [Flavobacteriaceae bacterium]